MADFTVKLTITGDGTVAVQAVKQVEGATRQMASSARQAGQQARQSFEVSAKGAANLSAEVTQAKAAVASLVAAAGGIAAVRGFATAFISAADAAGQLQARVKLATQSQAEYNAVMERVQQVAHDSYVSINDIAEVYVRSIEPMRQLGYNTKETLDLTEAMSLALVVSAADTQKRASAIDALSKVMQTGNVQMQEFMTLTTAAPRFVAALEASLGKTRAELIGMVGAGQLTAGELAKVGSELDKLRAEVELMPTTVGDAATRFRDAFQMWAGAANEGSGATALLVRGIDSLSNHIDTVMMVALIAATVALAQLAHQGVTWAAALIAQVRSAAASASAALADARAKAMEAEATLAAAAASRADAVAKYAQAQLTGGAAAASLVLAEAKAAETSATQALAAAQKQLGAATAAARTQFLTLGAAIGVAAAAAVGYEIGTWLRNEFEIARVAADYFVGATLEAWNRIKQGALVTWEAVKAVVVGAINTIREKLADLYGMYATLTSKLPGAGAMAEQLRSIEAALRPTSSAGDDFKAALERINGAAATQSKSIWSVIGDMVSYEAQASRAKAATEEYARTGVVTSATLDAAFVELAKSVDGEMRKLEEENFLVGKGAAGKYEYAKASFMAKAALMEEGAARDSYIARINATFDPLIRQAKANDALKASLDRATKSGDAAAKAAADYLAGLEKQVATYGLVGIEMQRYELAQLRLGEADRKRALDNLDMLDALGEVARADKEAADAMKALGDMSASLDGNIEELRGRLAGASAAQMAFNKTVRDAKAAFAAAGGYMNPAAAKAFAAAMAKAGEALDLSKQVASFEKVNDILAQIEDKTPFEKSIDAVRTLQEELDLATDPARIERLNAAISKMNAQIAGDSLSSYRALLGAVQKFTREGSSSFSAIEKGMAALSIVQDIIALRAAVIAVLTQGEGEPYSAWARMAAMAAAVAPILASIGQTLSSFGGGGGAPSAQSAEVRQSQQGTGSVLGDASAKSESIAHAIEITANATTQLVGLNRGMLRALQSLQAALGAAGNQLARGAGNADFAPVGSTFNPGDPFGGDPFGAALGSFLFGGSRKIIDQGIIIAGGALSDMLNRVAVGAYQTIQTSGGLFGGGGTRDSMASVSDEFAKQFQLVIGSIVDTVRAGALALGLLPADVEAALAAYRVEEIRISLKGLSAEEQQKELEAVFGRLFDGLAGSVVPFIGQFQRVGEGLGETLVRIATEVQVAQEAFRQLGLAVEQADPETVAQISDALIQAAGGLDAFIAGMQSFVKNFAPEGHQLEVDSAALASAFEQVGLSVPATRDGMWALMQSLDATTESGREQIATLLRLADVSDQYYSALDAQTKKLGQARELLDGMGLSTGGLSAFGKSLVDIKVQEAQAVDAANLLARAQGRAGASSIQLAQIHDWTAKQIAAAIRKLQAETRDLIAKLYGGVPGTLDAINARISELEQASGDWSDSIGAVADASAQLFEAWKSGVQSVQEYLDSMLLGDLSALTPEEQLAEARRQLLDTQAAAAGGDANALSQLPQFAEAYLRLARGSLASGEDYNAQFGWVRELLQATIGMDNPGTPAADAGPSTVVMLPSPELTALYAARDAALAAQETEYRAQLAADLTQHLADLAAALNVPIFGMIEAQGISLSALATDLGADLSNLTGASVEVLGNMATTLGVSLTALTGELGLTLADLSGGLTELTARVGIDLSALTVQSTQSLAALASSLGLDLADMATAVGVDLGNLADAQSLLNGALAAEIQALPDDQRDALAPLLQAITEATSEADANAAISALEDAVNAIGGGTATALAPYLSGVMPPRALDQLDYLADIQSIAADQLDVLGYIRDNLKAANAAAGVPSYAVGTGYVPRDGLAMIHEGEAVVPAAVNAWFARANWQLPRAAANDDDRIVIELQRLNERIDRLDRNNTAGHAAGATTTAREGERARQQRDDLARRQEQTIKRIA